ncbi:DUF4129 domain-containing protein [Arthrobacter sp. TMS1-12-1]
MGTTAGPQHERQASAVLTLIVLLLVVLAAAFIGDFSATPVMDAPEAPSRRTESPAPAESVPATPLPDGERIVVDGGTLAAVALVLLMLALALLTRFLLRFRIRQGPDGVPPEQADPHYAGTEARVPAALPHWAKESRAALAGGGADTPDAIIRCWLELERACTEVGIGRTAAQTTSEFASTVATVLDLPPRPLTTLNHLYQRARFGRSGRNGPPNPLGPTDRRAAAACVDELARSLASAPAQRRLPP